MRRISPQRGCDAMTKDADALLYGRLFKIAPELDAAFRSHMTEHALLAAGTLATRSGDYGVKTADGEQRVPRFFYGRSNTVRADE